MALVAVTAGNQAKASDVQQVIDLLKGVMTDQTIGIGIANRSQSGIYQGQNITAVSASAALFEQAGTLTAAATGDILHVQKIAGTVFATGTFNTLSGRGLTIDGSTFTKTGTGNFTADMFALYLVKPPPTITFNNRQSYSAYFDGHIKTGGTVPTLGALQTGITSQTISGNDICFRVHLVATATPPGANANIALVSWSYQYDNSFNISVAITSQATYLPVWTNPVSSGVNIVSGIALTANQAVDLDAIVVSP